MNTFSCSSTSLRRKQKTGDNEKPLVIMRKTSSCNQENKHELLFSSTTEKGEKAYFEIPKDISFRSCGYCDTNELRCDHHHYPGGVKSDASRMKENISQHKIFSDWDKISLNTSNECRRGMSEDFAVNDPLATDIIAAPQDDIESDFARLTEETEYDGGNIVCTLLVPDIPSPALAGDNSCLPTPDSDKDSGCFSEELNTSSLVSKLNVAVVESAPIPEDTDEVCKFKNGKRFVFPKPIYKLQSPRPFQRKIWKRRNGWFRVRNSAAERDTAVGASQQQQVLRSRLSEEFDSGSGGPGWPRGESCKYLSDDTGQAQAKECDGAGACEQVEATSETAEKEREKITLEQELSDNHQGLEIFSDTQDKIGLDGHRASGSESTLSDFHLQLAQMRLEIAEMVAEASRMENSDSEEEEISSWHLETTSQTSASYVSEEEEEEEYYSQLSDDSPQLSDEL